MPLRRPTATELETVSVRCREWSDWLADDPGAESGAGSAGGSLDTKGSAGTGRSTAVPSRSELAPVVRSLLAELAARHPGRALELRVPPHGAVQCGVAGTTVSHSRGTPPNVVETDARTLLQLAAGRTDFASARARGRISASGHAADLTGWLPLG